MDIPKQMQEEYKRACQVMKEIEAMGIYGQNAIAHNGYNQSSIKQQNATCDDSLSTCAIGKERTVLDTMLITSDRLERVTSKLWNIHALIFGSEPSECIDPRCEYETSVKSQAGRAFTSSNDLERLCDEIFNRLALE